MLHAFLAIVRSEEEWSTESHGCRAETETFEDVAATSDAGVDEHFELGED
jgi:hypothetical protein